MSLDYLTRAVKMGQRSRRRMRKHGQNMKGDRLWSREEEAVLIAHQGEYDLMSKLLPHRSRAAIASRCQLLGLRRKIHVWTAAELQSCVGFIPLPASRKSKRPFRTPAGRYLPGGALSRILSRGPVNLQKHRSSRT